MDELGTYWELCAYLIVFGLTKEAGQDPYFRKKVIKKLLPSQISKCILQKSVYSSKTQPETTSCKKIGFFSG